MHMKSLRLNCLILSLALLFCVLVFKDISYPLLWNDESQTVMTAKHILKFGYPKMHDGKNFIFLPDGGMNGGTWIGYKPSWDADITMPWGHYYFAAIGVFLADHVDNIYLKGGIIRTTFAIMGVIGLAVFMLSIRDSFLDKRIYQRVIVAFIFLELFSVSLLLHLREARYYSLVIFIVSCFFYVFIKHELNGKLSERAHALLMALVLFFAYQIHVATFLSFCLTIAIHEGIRRCMDILTLIKSKRWIIADLKRQAKLALRHLTPVLICGLMIMPFVILFETRSTIRAASEYYGYGFALFFAHLKRIYYVFSTHESLRWVILIKAIQIGLCVRYAKKLKVKSEKDPSHWELEKLSIFATLFFLSFCIMISRMPLSIIWTRYIIVLQPVMIIILLLDSTCIFRYITNASFDKSKSIWKFAFVALLTIGFIVNMQGSRITHVKEYIYQITHPLKGPLDFIIPYIRDNYRNPENIIVATNYEELCYVYYLNCKVILGGVNKNYEEDMKLQPDIIVYRKAWGQNSVPYVQLRQRARYKRVAFPVYDSNANNVAEMDPPINHQFRTRWTEKDKQKSDIFIRVQ